MDWKGQREFRAASLLEGTARHVWNCEAQYFKW
jgi:hypothetical protein